MISPKSRKGFYLVSPFLGFFFFLITVGIAAFFISENDQQIDTAKAGEGQILAFISYTIQADVFDVYFQNYLQSVLDSYNVGESNVALRTYVENKTRGALAQDLDATYRTIYESAFDVDCETQDTAYSLISITFTGERKLDILGLGSLKLFSPDGKTAIWPLISKYSLTCSMDEPPASTSLEFRSRWYYFDAGCICCQAPNACGLGGGPRPLAECQAAGLCPVQN